jgi:outer membrane protein
VQVSFRKILLGSLAAAAFAMPAMAEIKVGVVDYARLFEESPQAKVVQEGLRAEFGPRLQQLVTQENALKAKGEKLQKDVATMTPDQRSKAEKELRDSARELERKKGELQDDSNAKRQEEMNKLQRSLIAQVREYAKAQSYDIVIAEGVIYHTATVDITGAVLDALKANAPKPAATGATTPPKPPAKP